MHSACVFFPASFLQIRNSFFLSLGGYKIVFLFHKNENSNPKERMWLPVENEGKNMRSHIMTSRISLNSLPLCLYSTRATMKGKKYMPSLAYFQRNVQFSEMSNALVVCVCVQNYTIGMRCSTAAVAANANADVACWCCVLLDCINVRVRFTENYVNMIGPW